MVDLRDILSVSGIRGILSVRQPWAQALVGPKDVENRVGRRPLFLPKGGEILAICASKTRPDPGDVEWVHRHWPEGPTSLRVPYGAIVGVVEVLGLVELVSDERGDEWRVWDGSRWLGCSEGLGEDVAAGPFRALGERVARSPWASWPVDGDGLGPTWAYAIGRKLALPAPIPWRGALGLQAMPAELALVIDELVHGLTDHRGHHGGYGTVCPRAEARAGRGGANPR